MNNTHIEGIFYLATAYWTVPTLVTLAERVLEFDYGLRIECALEHYAVATPMFCYRVVFDLE